MSALDPRKASSNPTYLWLSVSTLDEVAGAAGGATLPD
jgi:hypothetical protein